jgi:GNAT superfamily N-acetyltransferase
MTTVIFPIHENTPSLKYQHYFDLNWYTSKKQEIKSVLNVCKFDFPTSIYASKVYYYGIAHIVQDKIATVGMVLVSKTNLQHLEIYSVCTDQLHRNKGYAKLMIADTLKYFRQYYKYAWIAIDVRHPEVYFKTLVKMYGQVGFQYYPTYGTVSPLGIQLKSGFVQLVNMLSKYLGGIIKLVNPNTINMAWKCAKLKATPQNVFMNSSVFEDLYKRYGHYSYEFGGSMMSTISLPISKTDKLIPIETITGVNLATLSQGDEKSMTVNINPGLYLFHTHPVTAIQLLRSVFAWPSLQDVEYTIYASLYNNPKLLINYVLSCEGFYIMHLNEYARAILKKFDGTQYKYFITAYKNHLQKELWEQQRYVWSVYFKELGWSTRVLSKDPHDIKTWYFEFTSPSGQIYKSLQDAIKSPEYTQDKQHFIKFMHNNLKNQIAKMNQIIGISFKKIIPFYKDSDTFLMNKYNEGIPVMYINFVPYSYKTPISQIIYNSNQVQIPELYYEMDTPIYKKQVLIKPVKKMIGRKITPVLKKTPLPPPKPKPKRRVQIDKMDIDKIHVDKMNLD